MLFSVTCKYSVCWIQHSVITHWRSLSHQFEIAQTIGQLVSATLGDDCILHCWPTPSWSWYCPASLHNPSALPKCNIGAGGWGRISLILELNLSCSITMSVSLARWELHSLALCWVHSKHSCVRVLAPWLYFHYQLLSCRLASMPRFL